MPRWTWRVQYYAFGTDRYPSFTLADDPAYPAPFVLGIVAGFEPGRLPGWPQSSH